MEPLAAPPDVAAALLTAGYRAVGPVGRGAQGSAWSAVALDGPPDRVVVRVVDLAADPRHAARLHRLRGVRHEHLATVRDVVALGPGACVMLMPHTAPGPTLEALRSARGPLSAGEAVTLTVPIADALAALHAAGLVHGDVSPANIVVGLDGRPVLVDLLGCLTGSAGTPGFVAPEVERGEGCGPAGDVYALAHVVLAHLGPEKVGVDRGVLGDAATDDRRVRDLLTGAADPDPRLRLAASELADACFRAHEAEPIVLPDSPVLVRMELTRLAGRADPTTTVRRTSRHRGRRAWAAPVVRAAVAVGAVAVCGVLAFALAQRSADDPAVALTPSGGSTAVGTVTAGAPVTEVATTPADTTPADPVVAAQHLTELRAAVTSAGDTAALTSVEVPGSRAYTADAALMDDLAARGLRVDGLAVSVTDTRVVSTATDQARVAVTSGTSGYCRVRDDGSLDAAVPAGGQRTVVLSSSSWPTGGGWPTCSTRTRLRSATRRDVAHGRGQVGVLGHEPAVREGARHRPDRSEDLLGEVAQREPHGPRGDPQHRRPVQRTRELHRELGVRVGGGDHVDGAAHGRLEQMDDRAHLVGQRDPAPVLTA
jgi:hypothetical protein